MRNKYGGFWRRLSATLIDYVILGFIFSLYFVVIVMSGWAGMSARKWGMDPDTFLAYVADVFSLFHLWCAVTWLAYFTCFHGWGGRTPGKMLLGLKVYLSSGGELTIAISFLRTAGYLLSAALLGLGFLWVLVDKKKRGWHDLVAGTVVVKKEKHLDKGWDIY